jgi:Protein of unknown function (DUF3352)
LPPTRTSHPRPRPLAAALHAIAVALLLAVLAVAVAGCGSSSSPGTAADPAGVIPASAPLYVGAVVRPSGALKTAAITAARTLTHQPNAYSRLLGVLQPPGSPPLHYSQEIAPWLGVNAGIFLTSLGASGQAELGQLQQLLAQVLQGGAGGGATNPSAWPFGATGVQGAIVLDTANLSKARSFLNTEAQHAGAQAGSYRGVAYQTISGGVAFAVVRRFVVIGSVAGLHSVIDTELGGPSLVHAAGYAKLLASAPSGVLAHVYANPAASTSGAAASASSLLGLLSGTHQLDVSLVPASDSIALDLDTLASGATAGDGGLLASGAEGAQALSELPGESWLAAGLGHVGATLSGDVQALHGLASLVTSLGGAAGASERSAATGFNVKGLLEGILTPLRALSSPGAQSKHAFLSWMSSAGIFASGTTIVDLRAGIVIDSNNPSLSHAAIAKLSALLTKAGGSVGPISIPGADAAISAKLNGLPVELDIANGRGSDGQTKFVIGLGEASVQDALHPSSTLSSAASSSVAAAALGEGARPSLTVDFPTLLNLLEGVGLSEDPSISTVIPYLRSLTTLAGGGKSLGGGIERFRLVLGLQQTG